MSKFGWSLPPGCTQKHIDDAFGDDFITALQDDVYAMLDAAKIAEKYIDGIMELIRKGEEERFAADAAAEAEAYADQMRDEKLLSDGSEDCQMLFLILHKVRGEPAYDIATPLGDRANVVWIIPTSGHRAYPYKYWALEDLVDISDINADGHHDSPWTHDDSIPADWPDHYDQSTLSHTPKPKTTIEDLTL